MNNFNNQSEAQKFIVINIIQNIFIFFLNSISRIVDKIGEGTRNAVVSVCCLTLVGYFIAYFTPSTDIRFRLTYDHIICSLILLVLILFSLKGELKKVRWNAVIFYSFFLAGLGILIISFLHPIGSGYRGFALMMMTVFPCLYLVWNYREDYDSLYKRLAASTAIIGLLYYAYCFYLSEKGELSVITDRVAGSFYDANMFSMIGMIMVCSSLYMLLVIRHSWGWFLVASLSMGAGISIVRLGVSRLAILAVLGSMVAFSIYYLKIQSSFTYAKRFGHKLFRAEILLVVVIGFILVGNLMLSINDKAIAEKSQPIDNTAAIENDDSASVDSGSTDIATSQETDISDAADRFSTEGKDLDAYTAGRYHIWKGYAQFLNMTGNDFSKADWNALTWNSVKHAHNNFLEIAYRCGIPVACIHTFLELAAGIICLIWLFSPKYKKPEYLFCIVFMICYTVQSLFDIATLPFERPAPFYFYMIMIPIFTFGTNKETEKKPKL